MRLVARVAVPVALLAGCNPLEVRERTLRVEAEPLVWTYDPAAPSSVAVEMRGGLTEEAGARAELWTMDGVARLTVPRSFEATMEVSDDPAPVKYNLRDRRTDVELWSDCGAVDCAWEGAFDFVDVPAAFGPVDVTIEVRAEIVGRFRSEEDARGAIQVSIVE